MKAIIQIPCFNEGDTLPQVIADLPRELPGFSRVEYLVIDDGSTDGTAEVARRLGVHHVVRHRRNRGLARAFRTGLDAALRAGADVIVNTDGDNQYCADDIAALVRPIVEGRADVVVGDRQTARLSHFSPMKKLLQRLGTFVVRQLSGTDVRDAVSGFRALSREAAIRLNIVSSFSYTTEMIIQAGHKGLAVASVPVRVNPQTRESRLFRSTWRFVERSATTILRMYAMYKPLRVFFAIGLVVALAGMVPILRFLWLWLGGGGDGHVQSLVLGGVLVVLGFVTFIVGILADLIGFNRQLLEMALESARRLELENGREDETTQTAEPKARSEPALEESAPPRP